MVVSRNSGKTAGYFKRACSEKCVGATKTKMGSRYIFHKGTNLDLAMQKFEILEYKEAHNKN